MPSQPEPGDVALGLDTVSLCCVAGQWAFTFIGWVVLATADAGHVDPGSDDYKDFSSLQFVMATAVTAWLFCTWRVLVNAVRFHVSSEDVLSMLSLLPHETQRRVEAVGCATLTAFCYSAAVAASAQSATMHHDFTYRITMPEEPFVFINVSYADLPHKSFDIAINSCQVDSDHKHFCANLDGCTTMMWLAFALFLADTVRRLEDVRHGGLGNSGLGPTSGAAGDSYYHDVDSGQAVGAGSSVYGEASSGASSALPGVSHEDVEAAPAGPPAVDL